MKIDETIVVAPNVMVNESKYNDALTTVTHGLIVGNYTTVCIA